MSSINKVILVGHLGKDPELRTLDGGVPVVSFPLVTSESYHKNGQQIEHIEWHNITMWRTLAETAKKTLYKGKLVYIEGKLRTRCFHDKEGVKRYATEVAAENFTMLGRTDLPAQGHDNNYAASFDNSSVGFKSY
jgi:single-strand DNA-binding protein